MSITLEFRESHVSGSAPLVVEDADDVFVTDVRPIGGELRYQYVVITKQEKAPRARSKR